MPPRRTPPSHTDGTGLTLNSTNKLCFNDASQFIQGSSNAILALNFDFRLRDGSEIKFEHQVVMTNVP